MCKNSVLSVCLCMVLCMSAAVRADVSVSALFTDHAVLQRNIDVPVFGTASVGEQVTVDFAGQSKSDTADGNGEWMVILDPMSASSSPSSMVVTGNNVITLTGVQVGEVWVNSGQSNMHFKLSSSVGGAEAVADAGNHNLRFLMIPTQQGLPGADNWLVSSPDTAGDFSAVAFYFGRALTQSLGGMAVGLIRASVPGSSIHEWTHVAGGRRDGLLYEKMIMALQPYAIRGANWYQGENDAHFGPEGYYDKLVGLIAEWRGDWGQGDFPFQIVQLHWKSDLEFDWALVRNDQLMAHLDVANTGFATAIDLPPEGGHPPTKEPVGVRLALSARHNVHGENIVWTGPIRDEVNSYVNGSQVVIAFDHVGSGLVTDDALDPSPVKLAGSDQVYYDADAQIVGNTLVASSTSVPNPVYARYIWHYSQGNLFNVEDLPAVPFEIDFGGGPTPTPTPTPTGTPTPTPTATPGPDMYVNDIAMTWYEPKSNYYAARATVWIKDEYTNDVDGATVTGAWSGATTSGDNQGQTGQDGKVTLESKAVKGGGTFTFTVTDVSATGYTYNPALNVMDSNSVTVP